MGVAATRATKAAKQTVTCMVATDLTGGQLGVLKLVRGDAWA